MKNKWLGIAASLIAVLIIANVLVMIPKFSESIIRISGVINTSTSQVTDFFGETIDNIAANANAVQKNKELTTEKDELAEKLKKLQIDNENLLAEINQIKKNDKGETEFKTIDAEIIGRSINSWYDTATLNVGSEDGIDVGSPMLINGNMYGYVESVTDKTSEVILLTNDLIPLSIPAMIVSDGTEVNGVIENYNFEKNVYEFTRMDQKNSVRENSIVQTNGFGNLTPKGIGLGVITEIEGSGANQRIYVQPFEDTTNQRYVKVIDNE